MTFEKQLSQLCFSSDSTVASGKSLHPQGRQAASTASDWSDVLNLDSVPFIDWE